MLSEVVAQVDGRVTDEHETAGAVDISQVTYDSRRVEDLALFCCLVGDHLDGHDFASDAVARGAVALIAERVLAVDVPQVVVRDARHAMGQAADALFEHPSGRIPVVGVTGTNGKTTTSALLRSILDSSGRSTAVIGTLTGERTTPEAPDLQAELARVVSVGCHAAVLEVSSHALALRRVAGMRFRIAVFTNLGHDHLDFHRTVDDYFAAKASLFRPEVADAAVVNRDDLYGRRLLESAEIPTIGYSMRDATSVEIGPRSTSFVWRDHRVALPLGGRFNIENALAAATTAVELGVTLGEVAAGLEDAAPVPGRFESIDRGQPFLLVVDYAHTPEGLEQVLVAARDVIGAGGTEGSVVAVFGCGGERDHDKRPAMGGVAAAIADRVILTSDNPRGEDPGAIIDDVIEGVPAAVEVVIEPDRRRAIQRAVEAAGAGDVVVIAGKGHETTQHIGDRVVDFDDRQVAREALGRLGGAAGS